MADTLNSADVEHWTHNSHDMVSGVRVDNAFYLLMGSPTPAWSATPLPVATQLSVAVMATQTRYTFSAGPVAVNLTFTSPQISSDYDLMSRPCHYFTYDVAATDGANHAVSIYLDISPHLVMYEPAANVSFGRVAVAPGVEALSMGATLQAPLSSRSDRLGWGVAYLVRDTAVSGSSVLRGSPEVRAAYVATGVLPSEDDPMNPQPLSSGGDAPPTGPQRGVDRSGNDMAGSPFQLASADPDLCWAACNTTKGCKAWAFAVPGCDQYSKPMCWLKDSYGETSNNKCRVSGAQAGQPLPGAPTLVAAATYDLGAAVGATPVQRFFMVAVDEILGINW